MLYLGVICACAYPLTYTNIPASFRGDINFQMVLSFRPIGLGDDDVVELVGVAGIWSLPSLQHD